MNIQNIEAGLHRAIKSQFIAAGAKDADAEIKAKQNLPAAHALFHKEFKEGRQKLRHDVRATTHAMQQVVAWVRTLDGATPKWSTKPAAKIIAKEPAKAPLKAPSQSSKR